MEPFVLTMRAKSRRLPPKSTSTSTRGPVVALPTEPRVTGASTVDERASRERDRQEPELQHQGENTSSVHQVISPQSRLPAVSTCNVACDR